MDREDLLAVYKLEYAERRVAAPSSRAPVGVETFETKPTLAPGAIRESERRHLPAIAKAVGSSGAMAVSIALVCGGAGAQAVEILAHASAPGLMAKDVRGRPPVACVCGASQSTIKGGEASLPTVSVELKDIPPVIENATGAVRIVMLKPSLFFKPISLPASDGLGSDYMRTSAMLRPPVFE